MKYCGNCGGELQPRASFCGECGEKIVDEAPVTREGREAKGAMPTDEDATGIGGRFENISATNNGTPEEGEEVKESYRAGGWKGLLFAVAAAILVVALFSLAYRLRLSDLFPSLFPRSALGRSGQRILRNGALSKSDLPPGEQRAPDAASG